MQAQQTQVQSQLLQGEPNQFNAFQNHLKPIQTYPNLSEPIQTYPNISKPIKFHALLYASISTSYLFLPPQFTQTQSHIQSLKHTVKLSSIEHCPTHIHGRLRPVGSTCVLSDLVGSMVFTNRTSMSDSGILSTIIHYRLNLLLVKATFIFLVFWVCAVCMGTRQVQMQKHQ